MHENTEILIRSPKLIALIYLVTIATLAGACSDPHWQSPVGMNIGAPAGETVGFIAVGDFGTGDVAQLRLAEAMASVCERERCDFVIGLGDNFYPDGVDSRTDVQFQSNFEQPFADFNIPFYMVLGNHDVERPVSPQSQIAYSSERWKLPGRWYAFRAGPVRLVALDTNLPASEAGDDQLSWVEDMLSDSHDAPWIIAFGHHPLYSNGAHGDAAGAAQQWLHAAICGSGSVDLYLAGHDHDLQWLAAKPDSCPGTEFVVSGAGARPRALESRVNTAHYMRGETLGFFWFGASKDVLIGRAYDGTGTLLFERTLPRRDPMMPADAAT